MSLNTTPSWAAQLVFDTLIFLLTLIRALRMGKAIYLISQERPRIPDATIFTDSITRNTGRIVSVLIRDGFVYYTVMLCKQLNLFSLLYRFITPLTRYSTDKPYILCGLAAPTGPSCVRTRACPQSDLQHCRK